MNEEPMTPAMQVAMSAIADATAAMDRAALADVPDTRELLRCIGMGIASIDLAFGAYAEPYNLTIPQMAHAVQLGLVHAEFADDWKALNDYKDEFETMVAILQASIDADEEETPADTLMN